VLIQFLFRRVYMQLSTTKTERIIFTKELPLAGAKIDAKTIEKLRPALRIGARCTVAHQKLTAGLVGDGAAIIRRARGYSDYDVIERLVTVGWLEPRKTGPRGGTRYYTTQAGKQALEASN
jgi:hypothetical protein